MGFKVHNEITNISNKDITIEEVSSFVLGAIMGGIEETKDTYIYRFLQSHHGECQPRKYSLYDLGLFNANKPSQKRIFGANIGSWSTKEELPQAILEYRDEYIMFSIESNNDWYYEVSDNKDKLYIYTGGANINYGNWYKRLSTGETYQTVDTKFSFGSTLDDVICEMTKLRRLNHKIREIDKDLPIVFNEYMHLSWAEPYEERTKNLVKAISDICANYYVIDCGWHNEEECKIIFSHMGQWKESSTRYPSGIKYISDLFKANGIKLGLWIEPDIIGDKCSEMLEYYTDDCLLKRNGEVIRVMGRVFPDFTKPKVIDYLNKTIDRMVNIYGEEYIKMDYNQYYGIGTDNYNTSLGEGLEIAQNAFLSWAKDIIEKYPNVIFETCASGGLRMDDKTMSYFDMVSTSDQTYYYKYPYIVGNIFSSVLPEQAGVWSAPVSSYGNGVEPFKETEEYVNDNSNKEEIVMNMINAILGRMHLSSHIELLNEDKKSLIREGIDVYHSLTEFKKHAFPIFPLGFTDFTKDLVSVGLKDDNKIYLAVWHLKGENNVDIPLNKKIKDIKIIYPASIPVKYSYKDGILNIKFSEERQARLFEINLK